MPTKLHGAYRASTRSRVARVEPIRRLSLAPLAGVILIATTLIALSYPLQTHALTFDVYPADWFPSDVDFQHTHQLDLHASGKMSWNDQPVTQELLAKRLNETLSEPVEPILLFRPDDNASYLAVAEVLAIIERSGVSGLCITGLERNRRFELPQPQAEVGNGAQWPENCDIWRGKAHLSY